LVVLRARAMGTMSTGQVSGIYTSDMLVADVNREVIKQLDRDTNVPAPSTENATFNEFPSFPRIAKNSSKIGTRGQHTPFFSFEGEVVGTTGIFVNLAVDSAGVTIQTGISNIGNASGLFSIDGTK
jgi:hypothetical protein